MFLKVIVAIYYNDQAIINECLSRGIVVIIYEN